MLESVHNLCEVHGLSLLLHLNIFFCLVYNCYAFQRISAIILINLKEIKHFYITSENYDFRKKIHKYFNIFKSIPCVSQNAEYTEFSIDTLFLKGF